MGGALSSKESKKDEPRGRKSKKDKKKKGKKRRSSSSESSSDSSESSDSSSESSESSTSSTDSETRRKRNKKRKSNSPTRSDHMMDARFGQSGSANFDPMDEHELKVKKFLEMSRDESDYEDKVAGLLAEASKYQKSKQ